MMDILELIQCDEDMVNKITYRIPAWKPVLFKIGSTLNVQERQVAVFFKNGKALDVFDPGQYKLTQKNLPLLIAQMGKEFSKDKPFSAEIYFVSTYKHVDRKWGTPLSILVTDPHSSVPLIRAIGTYSYQISSPRKFVEEIGKQGLDSSSSIIFFELFLHNILRSILIAVIGKKSKGCNSGVEIINSAQEIADLVYINALVEFEAIGITLVAFDIVSIFPAPKMGEELKEMGVQTDDSSSNNNLTSTPTSNTIIVKEGEVILGDKTEVKLGKNAVIFGDFVVAKSVKNSFNKADSANLPYELKKLLKDLAIEVGKMSEALSEEEASRAIRALDTIVDEASNTKPNREWWQISVDGLTKAAQKLAELGKPVLEILGKLVPILLAIS